MINADDPDRKTPRFSRGDSSPRPPLDPREAASAAPRFAAPKPDNGALMWLEGRPQDKGRVALMRREPDGRIRQVSPASESVGSSVHEYGGRAFEGGGDEIVYAARGGLFALNRVLAAPRKDRDFAEPILAPRHVIAVAERRRPDRRFPENFIARIPLNPERPIEEVEVLIEGKDFYAAPDLSPDRGMLTWMEWSLPRMPWERSALGAARLDDEGDVFPVAAPAPDGDVFQPQWSSDGALLYIHRSEGENRSALRRWTPDMKERHGDEIFADDADLGRPLWSLGARSYGVLADGRIAVSYYRDGDARLVVIDPRRDKTLEMSLAPPYRGFESLSAADDVLYAIALRDDRAPSIVALTPPPPDADADDVTAFPDVPDRAVLIRGGGDAPSRPASRGRLLPRRDDSPPALFHPPDADADDGRPPPAVVLAHGGPTGMAERGFHPRIQFWTSRGFAVLDVDYAGSWGYDPLYRDALNGRWGRRDADDLVAAAERAVNEGRIDPERIAVSGSSAGGFTALRALIRSEVFAVASIRYGIADPSRLKAMTHKFEAGYLDTLFAGEGNVADEELLASLSPLADAERIAAPTLLLQGLEDRVVPPEQSRLLIDALAERGRPVASMEFVGEGHGFRRAETVAACLAAESHVFARALSLPNLLRISPPPDGLEMRNETALGR